MEGHDKGKEEGRKKTMKGMRKGRKREDENLKDKEKEKRERGNNTMTFFLKSMHLNFKSIHQVIDTKHVTI
jgi:hypothetical protein